jgi:hypothetical protein
MMPIIEICRWLQSTSISVSIRESLLMFPLIEGTHLLALGLSTGTIVVSDLRMMGLVLKKESASDVLHQILPWAIAGYAVMIVTGVLLFLSEPVKCYGNTSFRYKLLFLLLAGINVLVFHSTKVYRRMNEWEHAETPPRAAKLAGLISLISWGVVIIAGRTTAYHF